LKQIEDIYFNRELSWLTFNERVLAQSCVESFPLLERLNFIAISARTLDEFYMFLETDLKSQQSTRIKVIEQNELKLAEVLTTIHECSHKLMESQQTQLKTLKKELHAQDFSIVDPEELSQSDKKWLENYFTHNLLPVLTPLVLGPSHPFPFIPNMGFAIALELQNNQVKEIKALIPLPPQITRFIQLPGEHQRFILAEDVIISYIHVLFPEFHYSSHGCFRVLRNCELEFPGESKDFIQCFEAALIQREKGAVIRLDIDENMPPKLSHFVKESLDLERGDVMMMNGILGLSALEELRFTERPDLRFPPYIQCFPECIQEFDGNIFAAIAHKDLLVHHPYESFDVVVQFLQQAARDPQVISIKQTLYRTSSNSPIIAALCEAAENGKNVTVIVEIKARLDEKANLLWVQELVRAGAMVLYGILGYESHGKFSLVTRQEERGLQIYTHFGTGNYHPITARTYDDLSLFTGDFQIGEEASKIFNYLTGYPYPKQLKRLAFAPIAMRDTIEDLIRAEINYAKKGEPSSLWAKMNSLSDPEIIDLLYEASCAGVSIDLIIRDVCCLRPGIKGLSENIRVKSVVGRFLEHSRIICFGHGHPLPSSFGKVFITSADWIGRNLDWRFEIFIPIKNKAVKEKILNHIMGAYIKDVAHSWKLMADGTYQPMGKLGKDFSAQDYFMQYPSLSGRMSRHIS
jgi:polyphosphate kinase